MASPAFLSPAITSEMLSPYDMSSDTMSDCFDLPPAAQKARKSTKKNVSSFIQKLYNMLQQDRNSDLISWNQEGNTFYVYNARRFAQEILPVQFKHSNFSSFVRLLNMYGFHKINKSARGQRNSEKEVWEFSHTKFQRDRPDMLKDIRRKALDSEIMRRETDDLQSSVSGLQMSHGDLVQQIHSLQDTVRQLMMTIEGMQRIQTAQQMQIQQMADQQGISVPAPGALKWDATTGPFGTATAPGNATNTMHTTNPGDLLLSQPLPMNQPQPNTNHQRQLSAPDNFQLTLTSPPSEAMQDYFQTVPAVPAVSTTTTSRLPHQHHGHSLSTGSMPMDFKPMQMPLSPATFNAAVNTPLPKSPMNTSPDLAMSPGTSEDSVTSLSMTPAVFNHTIDHSMDHAMFMQ
ncbi:HSF-type DNA-binding-domain-containing protein [Gongronella butleri]|nr:HSF-type DNA-binding-domain-containing protein [Gongronella butleri]